MRLAARQPRLEALGRATQGKRLRVLHARLVRMLVAADAAVHLARLERGPAPHRLDAAPVLVDELEIERGARRRAEAARAVRLHVRLAQDVLHVVRAVAHRDRRADLALRGVPAVLPVPADVDGTVLEPDHAEPLHASLRRARHRRAGVDVLHVVRAEALAVVELRERARRRRAALHGNRLHAVLPPVERQQLAAARLVHRVHAEARRVRSAVVAASLGHVRDEKPPAAERERIRPLRAELRVHVEDVVVVVVRLARGLDARGGVHRRAREVVHAGDVRGGGAARVVPRRPRDLHHAVAGEGHPHGVRVHAPHALRGVVGEARVVVAVRKARHRETPLLSHVVSA